MRNSPLKIQKIGLSGEYSFVHVITYCLCFLVENRFGIVTFPQWNKDCFVFMNSNFRRILFFLASCVSCFFQSVILSEMSEKFEKEAKYQSFMFFCECRFLWLGEPWQFNQLC